MHTVGSISFLLLVIVSFILLCVVAFAGDDFWQRHDWKQRPGVTRSRGSVRETLGSIDLGRLFCVWLYRSWCLLLILTLAYFFGAKYVA